MVLKFLWIAFVNILKFLWLIISMTVKYIFWGIGIFFSYIGKIIQWVYSFIRTYEVQFEKISLFVGICALLLMILGRMLFGFARRSSGETLSTIRNGVVIEARICIWVGALLNLFVYTSKYGFFFSFLIQIGVFILYIVLFLIMYGDSFTTSSDSSDYSCSGGIDYRKRDELSVDNFHHLYDDLSSTEKEYIDRRL